jgi:PhnB protein
MTAKRIPDGYNTVTPYLIVGSGVEAIEFYKKALGAREKYRINAPEGKLGHAELVIGDSTIMLADEFPEMGARSPKSFGGTPVSLMIYVEDVDARFKQAIDAGAKETRPLRDQFYGDRSGTFEDPFGHTWTIASRLEDVSPEEMERRAQKEMQSA